MTGQSNKHFSNKLPANTVDHYDHFFGPLYFEPFALTVAQRIEVIPHGLVVEIGAGTGRLTRHLRKRLPITSKLIASDIDTAMLDYAKHQLRSLKIDWQVIDAQQLPFPHQSIDLLVSCFTYMFVPDQPKAFTEAYRVLKPNGKLLFTTWDKLENNEASYAARSIAMKYLDKPLPPSVNLATSMSNEADIKSLLADAGFTHTAIQRVQLQAISKTAKEAADGLVSGAIFEKIYKRNPAYIVEIKQQLEKDLASKFGAAPMVAPISALICEAVK